MPLRITDQDQLDQLPANIRSQIDLGHLEDSTPLGTKTRAQVNRPEEDCGRMLTTWIDLVVLPNGLRPGLFFYHIPNGLARNATEGGIFKAQGLRAGWPDYGLDLPVGPYHGFRLEIKAEHGAKPTPKQLEILERLESVGYKCGVAWGFDDGKRQLEEYWHGLLDPTD